MEGGGLAQTFQCGGARPLQSGAASRYQEYQQSREYNLDLKNSLDTRYAEGKPPGLAGGEQSGMGKETLKESQRIALRAHRIGYTEAGGARMGGTIPHRREVA